MRDEHDPLYDPDEIWEENIPGIHWLAVVVAFALVMAIVLGRLA